MYVQLMPLTISSLSRGQSNTFADIQALMGVDRETSAK